MQRQKTPKGPPTQQNVRLSLAPDTALLEMLDRPWPFATSRHRRLRMALRLGLDALAQKTPDEFRALVLDEIEHR